MKLTKELKDFEGNYKIIGAGAMASSLIPFLIDVQKVESNKISILSKENLFPEIFEKYKITVEIKEITPENCEEVLLNFAKKDDILYELTTEVDSYTVCKVCGLNNILYSNMGFEKWKGNFTDPNKTLIQRSVAIEHMKMRGLQDEFKKLGVTTSSLQENGQNPGGVQMEIKFAHLEASKKLGLTFEEPRTQEEWQKLSKDLNVQVCLISERDTQIADIIKRMGVMVNTWSIFGFYEEGTQPAECQLGTHEKVLEGWKNTVEGTRWYVGDKSGFQTRILGYTPKTGVNVSLMIQHGESLQSGKYFSSEDHSFTCYYSYCPNPLARLSVLELQDKQKHDPPKKIELLRENIIEGDDELGVLLMGIYEGKQWAYWFGKLTSIDEARSVCDHNSATTIQIVACGAYGLKWLINNPNQGMKWVDDIDYIDYMNFVRPYMGTMFSGMVDFNPLDFRDELFPEKYNLEVPNALENFLR